MSAADTSPDPSPPAPSGAADATALKGRPTPRWPFLMMLPLVLMVLSLAWQSFQRTDPAETRARHLYLACQYFSTRNNGRLPDTLAELVPKYYIEGGPEKSLYDVSRYTLLQPGKSFEVVRLENRPMLLEKTEGAATAQLVLVRGSGKLERVDLKKEFPVSN